MYTTKDRTLNRILTKLLTISGFFIVPTLTSMLGSKTSLLYENFTYLANQQNTRIIFMIWAIISLITHFGLLIVLFTQHKLRNQQYAFIAFVFLFIAIILPYPSGTNIFGVLHVLFGYVAFFFYNITLFQLYTQTRHYKPNTMNHLATLYLITLSTCSAVVFAYGSINGLVEILYFSITPILLATVHKTLLTA